MKSFRKTACQCFLFVLFMFCTTLFTSGVASAEGITLKIGWTTSDGAKDPYAIAAREFATALEEVSPGTFTVKFFPNRQLGDEKEMLEGLSFGTINAAIITNAVVANIEPSFQLNDMPFLYSNEAQAHKVLDGEVGQELMRKLAKKKIIGLGFAEGGFRNMINNKRPVYEPKDVSGVKYRVMQNPLFIEMFSALGGNAVPMAWGEVFTAVQQGTIDGLEIPVAVIHSNKFSDVTKNLSLTKHTYSALSLLYSNRSFKKLSPEQQDSVRKAARLSIDRQRQKVAQNTLEIIEELKTQGMNVNTIKNPQDFRALVGNIYEEFKPQIGIELFNKTLTEVQ